MVENRGVIMQEQIKHDLIADRNKRLEEVYDSIVQVNELNNDLGALVYQQDHYFDDIDYYIEDSKEQTEKGVEELNKAEQSQKKRQKWCFRLFLLVLLLVFIIITILLIIVNSK